MSKKKKIESPKETPKPVGRAIACWPCRRHYNQTGEILGDHPPCTAALTETDGLIARQRRIFAHKNGA